MQLFVLNTTTPLGNFCMLMDEHNVVHASGFGTPLKLKDRLGKAYKDVRVVPYIGIHEYTRSLEKYFAGEKDALKNIKKQQSGSVLQRKVWLQIEKIKWGKTESYKFMASRVGYPRAMRAVGSACGANALVLLVPCHRVLRTDGGPGGYAFGVQLKRRLLEMERGGA
ncbi:MAG TPA: methylated-DNA--[protein]-cysteine S-methyltransferase [Candidatus Paceibacterota bacterium]|nr:methylated-DNA--[protein]-cysteine S-methyltransferase [Candidatus Paceibacterota bacterium]